MVLPNLIDAVLSLLSEIRHGTLSFRPTSVGRRREVSRCGSVTTLSRRPRLSVESLRLSKCLPTCLTPKLIRAAVAVMERLSLSAAIRLMLLVRRVLVSAYPMFNLCKSPLPTAITRVDSLIRLIGRLTRVIYRLSVSNVAPPLCSKR